MTAKELLVKRAPTATEEQAQRALEALDRPLGLPTNGREAGTVDWSDEAWKDVRPMDGDVGNMALLRGGMSDEDRNRQQESLRELGAELEAEGFDGSEYLPGLIARAATWPE